MPALLPLLCAALLGQTPPAPDAVDLPPGYPDGPGEFAAATADPRPVSADRRAVTAAGTLIGAVAGGLIGSAGAVGLGASFAGPSTDARSALPVLAMPPLFVGAGAIAGAYATGGSRAAWGAGAGGVLGAGAATLVLGLLLLDTQASGAEEGTTQALIAGSLDVTFLALTAVPTVTGAAAAATTAAVLVEE